MPNSINLLLMLLREWLSSPQLARRAEPAVVMDDAASVAAFHEQGAPSGPLLPVYRFNALAASRMLPPGGVALDLGSGSGQYLAYLAARRPDVRIIGVDLSRAMVDRGRRFLQSQGLDGRVDLRVGDMTNLRDIAPDRVDLVSTIFALHHLPAIEDLQLCLAQIAEVRSRHQCAVWIFDHARPRHANTPEVFPLIFSPAAPRVFQEDSRNSLIASFTSDELTSACQHAGLADVMHFLARWMPLYQVHWARARAHIADGHGLWQDDRPSGPAIRDFRRLCRLFPDLRLLMA